MVLVTGERCGLVGACIISIESFLMIENEYEPFQIHELHQICFIWMVKIRDVEAGPFEGELCS